MSKCAAVGAVILACFVGCATDDGPSGPTGGTTGGAGGKKNGCYECMLGTSCRDGHVTVGYPIGVPRSPGCPGPENCGSTSFYCPFGCKGVVVSNGPNDYPSISCNSPDAGIADADAGSADVDAGCSDAAMADACCCQLDQAVWPVCVDGGWSCPAGFSYYSGEQCTSCPGPCCTGPDASDAALD